MHTASKPVRKQLFSSNAQREHHPCYNRDNTMETETKRKLSRITGSPHQQPLKKRCMIFNPRITIPNVAGEGSKCNHAEVPQLKPQ